MSKKGSVWLKATVFLFVAGLFIFLPFQSGGLLARPLTADWTGWSHNVQARVQNNVAAELDAGYTVELLLDTAALVSQGSLQSNCADLRISYNLAGSDTELDRSVEGCNTTLTTVKFKTQTAIAAGATDSNYLLHYGNPAAGAAPADPHAIFAFYEDFQDGDAAGWIPADGTWAVAQEASNFFYRYSGGGSGWAISYVDLPGLSNLDLTSRVRGDADTKWIGLAFRIQDPANFLTFYESKDVNQFKLARIAADNHAFLGPQPGFGMDPGQWYRIRMQAVGTTLRGRIWLEGTAEPTTWLISVTDATYQTRSGLGATLYQHINNADWDEITARKLVEVEPTVSLDWGSQGWWDNAWGYRRGLTITNASVVEALPVHYSTGIILDTASLIGNGQMRSDCADLRVIFTGGASPVELDRVVEGCNTPQTKAWFGLQHPVAVGGEDNAYDLYYGNPIAGSPPSNSMNVFLFFEDWEQGTIHWTSAAGMDPANSGTMGTTLISTADFYSPANSQQFPQKRGGGDAFSGFIPVTPSTGYAMGVWAKSPNSINWGPLGYDPYTAAYVKGTENWLWTSEWGIGSEWSFRSARFVTGGDAAFIKIKSELWTDSPGTPPIYFDNLILRYALAVEPTLALGDEETILAVPTITNIVDNAPVLLGSALNVSADVASAEGTVDAVTLRILAPEAVDIPMTLTSGDNLNGTWQGSFTPVQGGVYSYRVRALASTGRSKLSEEKTFTVSDTQPPQITLVSIIDPILVRNTQTLTVSVTDNGQLASVTVDIGGVTHPMSQQGSQYTYSWQVTQVGVVSYTVHATDTSGNPASLPGSFTSEAREADVCTWKDCKSGASSFSMDDGNSACRAELEAAGMRGTYYYNGSSNPGWFADYSAAGHEVSSHTVGHPCNVPCCSPNCTPESLANCPYTQTDVDLYRQNQLDPNIQVIENATGKPVLSLAWPCGCTDPGRMQAASFYYLGARGYYDYIAELTWLQDVNLATPVNFMNLNTANSYSQTLVDRAIAENKWAITTSHGSCAGITYMASRSDVLWNAPVGEVLRYIKVRDAAQFSNYARAGRTISFDVAHNLPVFTRQTLSGQPLLPILFDNPVTLKVHILDTDTVLNVQMDGATVPHQVITADGARYVTFEAALNTLRHVVVNLSEPAPTIGAVTDNGPVELSGTVTVNATITNPGGSVGQVFLRLVAPQSTDIPMTPVAGQPDAFTASFAPSAIGTQSYRVRAANSDGIFAESALFSVTIFDATVPGWRNLSQTSPAIQPGGTNTLSAEGMDPGGLDKAVLMTDESGAWQEFDLPAGDWWDYRWSQRKPVVVTEAAGLDRANELVDLAISASDLTGLASCTNELRVTDANQVEIPSQVYNERLEGGILACNLLFPASLPANSNHTFYVYWGNPAASPPAYTTDLTASAGIGVTTVASNFFNLDLDNDSAVISRLRLPQGNNLDLPLSSEGDSYWGFHQVCSSLDGNIAGKNNLCIGGTAPAGGLSLQTTISGPLLREYVVTNVKGAAVYTIRFRFFANTPYYQYTLSRSNTTSAVMNNFWYTNGYFPRLGIGQGGTPAATFNTYGYNSDTLRMASFTPVDYQYIDGLNNDGTDLGGTDYQHPTASGLGLYVVTGVDAAGIESNLSRIAASLSNQVGATENAPTGMHGSPVFFNGATGWSPASFQWQNASIPAGQTIQWRVKFCDASGNCGLTDIMSFSVEVLPFMANNDTYSTQEDTAINEPAPGVLANDTAPGNPTLTAILVTGPAHGTLALNPNGSFVYTPAGNWYGTDSFTYKANDGSTDSNVATVTLNVSPVNDGPVAVGEAYTTAAGTPLTVAAPGVLGNDTDVENQPLSALLVTAPAHGTLALQPDGGFTYTPAAGYSGADSFTYKANDGQADSNTVTVSLTVGAPPEPICVVYQRSLHGTVADNYIWESVPTGSYHTAPTLYTGERNHATRGIGETRLLLRFALDDLPAGAAVQSATLAISVFNSPAGETIAIHPITTAWSEASSATWSALSAAYEPASAASLTTAVGLASTDITALVQSWLDGSRPNHGMMLINASGGDLNLFRSSEYATVAGRPSLQVCYLPSFGEPASIELTPASANIPAGAAQAYTVTASDAVGNTWDVTAQAQFSIDEAAGGSWNANTYTSQIYGVWTVTATLNGLSDTAGLTVSQHGAATSIDLAPSAATITAGQSQAYTVTANDGFGNSWDVTTLAEFSTDSAAGGAWSANTYTAENSGVWSIAASYNGLNDTALLSVLHASPVSLDLTPATASIPSGSSITYHAHAADTYGNAWEVSATTTFSIDSAAGGSWSANTYTSAIQGSWTVSAAYETLSDTAALEVTGSVEPICVVYQRGLHGTVADNYIWESVPTSSYHTAPTLYTGERNHATRGPGETRLLLRFALDDLPAGAAVQSATLAISVFNSPAGETIAIHPITTAWSEASSATWSALSAAYEPASAASLTTAVGLASTDITALVQSWLDGSRPNHGMMLINASGGDLNLFRSSEYATVAGRPSLQVCYTPGNGQ